MIRDPLLKPVREMTCEEIVTELRAELAHCKLRIVEIETALRERFDERAAA